MNTKLYFPIYPPVTYRSYTQLFGVDRATYSNAFGIPGHNGIDFTYPDDPDSGFGREVVSAHTTPAKVVARIDADGDVKNSGNALYLREILENGEQLETIYMHLSKIVVNVGDIVQPKQIIGLVGNSGFVRPRPTTWAPRAGSHLHFMVRMYDISGNIKWNEYGGAIDPIPLLYSEGMKLPIRFTHDLSTNWWANPHDDEVAHWQTVLAIEGFAKDYTTNGIFGPKTKRDTSSLQLKYRIEPSSGYFGLKTRTWANEKYAT